MEVPTKVFKATIYVVDIGSDIGDLEKFRDEMEYRLEGTYLSQFKLEDLVESPEFEWHDDIDLNLVDASKDVFEKYFIDKSK
ncbi:hypothetical protein [Enterococcus avium]|uniref:hypothetical protein n=1 Tax=Enterococcus avium TaxID=33945 RepID=UPI0034623B93